MCSQAGGMCLAQDECPIGQLADAGLCPKQRARGAECCHGREYDKVCAGLPALLKILS